MRKRILSMLVLLAAVVTGAVAQTNYKVSVKEGTTDATNWTITPAEATTTGVAAGTEVKATYAGTKKVKSVKAVKKTATPAAPKALAEATAEDVGKIAGADGNIYADAAAATAASTTAVAMIAYVGNQTGDATYNHGLAIALSNEGNLNWSTAKSTCEGKAAVTGAKWYLPSRDNWAKMIAANGGNQNNYSELNTKLETASGESSKLSNGDYWTSTNGDMPDEEAYIVSLSDGSANFSKNTAWGPGGLDFKLESRAVRACLAF